jgi:membrane protein YdbS with pleckstrin-like domain
MSVFSGNNPQGENTNEGIQETAVTTGKAGLFNFQKMITPVVMQVIYILGVLALFIGMFVGLLITVGIIQFGYSASPGSSGILIILGCFALLFLWRVSCESVVVFFSIHEELVRIRKGITDGKK